MGRTRTWLGGICLVTISLLVATAAASGASPGAPDLDREFWVVEVDSVENQQIYSAQSAIDGDPATFWHTSFSQSPHPHWMTIDLLRNAEVEGFRYQGRPDGTGVPNGRVGNYAFYVSETPTDWTALSPVATGTFADDDSVQEVTFSPTYGRYLTFVALSEAGDDGGWTTVAELNVMGRFRDVSQQAVVGSVATWDPVVEGLASFACSISQTAGTLDTRARAWVDPTCSTGLFDTGGLPAGDHAFEYLVFDGSTHRRGLVTVTVREPMRVYDTAWSIPLRASVEELETYFTFLEGAGYDGLWISLVPYIWQGGLDEPNRYGHAFESFDNPNPLYLDHVDNVLDTAATHNLKVNIVVAWAADWVGDRPQAKWHGDMGPAPIHETNGAAYGAVLANRWKGHPALEAWVMGGDWWTPETEAATEPTWEAIVAGIRGAGATEPITYHTGGFHSSWVLFADREWVDFLSPETSHCLVASDAQGVLTALKAQFGKEVVSAEMRYEDEPMQARGVSTWCYPEGPAVGHIGEPEISADARASFDAGAAAYVYGQDTRWNWGGAAGLATLGRPGEYAALDIARDGKIGDDTAGPVWPGGSSLSGSSTDTSVSLTWSTATDNTGVAIYRVVEETRGVMGRVPGGTFTLGDLQSGTTYHFTMEAVDAAGNSTAGPTLSITTSGQPPAVQPGDRVALFDSTRGMWHLRHGSDDSRWFYYGVPGDVPLMGDWDGDGDDTPGMYRPSNGFAYLTNELPAHGSAVVADPGLTFFFGVAGDQVVVGDWDGNGTDTLGIRRAGKMFLTNVNATSTADIEFYFGVPGDLAIGGDADGDGRDSIFLYRPSSGYVYFTTALPNGPTEVAPTSGTLFYGLPSDRFIVGDWNDSGYDTVGVFRPVETAFHLRNTNTTGPSDVSFFFGQGPWLPASGHF